MFNSYTFLANSLGDISAHLKSYEDHVKQAHKSIEQITKWYDALASLLEDKPASAECNTTEFRPSVDLSGKSIACGSFIVITEHSPEWISMYEIAAEMKNRGRDADENTLGKELWKMWKKQNIDKELRAMVLRGRKRRVAYYRLAKKT